LIAVLGTSFVKGEFNEMWEFNEEEFVTPSEEEQEKQ